MMDKESVRAALQCPNTEDAAFPILLGEAMHLFSIEDRTLGDALGVAPSTVARWRTGTALPARLVRPMVLRELRKLCRI